MIKIIFYLKNLFKDVLSSILRFLNSNPIYWITIIPILFMASYVSKIQEVPNNDYWASFFLPIFNQENFIDSIKGLAAGSNEHLTLTTNVLYLLNVFVSGGNNKGLFLINLLLTTTTLVILIKLFKDFHFFNEKYLWLASFITAILIFSPAMSHNWIRSMSGVAWFLANTFFIISLVFAYRMENINRFKHSLKILVIFSLISFTSYSTGLITPIVIFIYLFVTSVMNKKFWHDLFIYGCFMIAIYAWWLIFWYQRSLQNPELSFSLLDKEKFILSFLGNGFTESIQTSIAYGIVGLGLYLVLGIFIIFNLLKKSKFKNLSKIIFFYCISTYAFLNIIMATVARSGQGDPLGALANRYANITTLFWLGIILAILYLAINIKKYITTINFRVNFFIIILFLFIIFPSYRNGIYSTDLMINEFQKNDKPLQLGLEMGVYDRLVFESIINNVIYNDIYSGNYSLFTMLTEAPLRSYHYPFNKKLVKDYQYGFKLEKISFDNDINDRLVGSVDKIEKLKRNVSDKEDIPVNSDKQKDYKLTGWVCLKGGGNIQDLLIVDTSNKIVGAGIVSSERGDVATLLGEHCLRSGFIAYLKEPRIDMKYRILISNSTNNIYYIFKDIKL